MNPLRLLVPAALMLCLAACVSREERSSREFKNASSHIDSTLAGEWVSPHDSNFYLLFKPEEGQDHSGRFGGIGEYDRYRVISKLQSGGSVDVELLTSSPDAETLTQKINIRFGQKYRTLTVTVPNIIPGRAPTRTMYEKVRD